MKTKVIKNKKETEFKKICFYETEGAGIFFRVNQELGDEDKDNVNFINFYDVLMVLDQNYLQGFEEGELVLNLTSSKIVFVPYKTRVVLLNNTNETVFEEIMYEEPEE